MERDFFVHEGVKVMKIISASPEEAQTEDGPLPDRSEWPEGQYIDVVKRIENGKIVRYVGLAKVGERLRVPGEAAKPEKQAAPKAIELPPVVQNASDETLEVMAARNNITVNDKWRKRSRAARQADVAAAMQNTRRMPEMVGGQLVK